MTSYNHFTNPQNDWEAEEILLWDDYLNRLQDAEEQALAAEDVR